MQQKLYRIEASELVKYVVEVRATDLSDAMNQATKIMSDEELSKDCIDEFTDYQTDRILVDNGNGFFEEVEDEPAHFVDNGVRTSLYNIHKDLNEDA